MYSEVLIQNEEEAEGMEGVRFENQQQEQRNSLPSFRRPPTISDLQAQNERDRQQQVLE